MSPAPRRLTSRFGLALLGFAGLGACEDPVAPPISPDAFELDFTSRFEQVWGEPARGYIDFAVLLPAAVTQADLERIDSMAVTWPFGAIVTQIPLDFADAEGGVQARQTVIRDNGLAEGWYTLTIGFDDGQEVTVERVYQGEPLPSPLIRAVEVGDQAVEVRWRTTAAHDWRISLRRLDPGAPAVLDQASGSVASASAEFSATMAYESQPGADYDVVLEMEAPYNYRRLTIPITTP